MAASCWLDVYRGAPGLEGPFLQESSEPYRRIPPTCRMVMVIRGEKALLRGKQVHLHHMENSTMIANCGLHLQQSMHKVKAGPQPENTRLHPINMDPLASPADIAHRFYSLILAPICTSVVFFANEFSNVEDIVEILVRWIRDRMGRTSHHRPRVLLVCDKHATRLSNLDLERRMTAQVLATCNPVRDLTAKSAEAIWRGAFGGLVIGTGWTGLATTPWATTAQTCPPLVGTQFISLLESGCKQFAHGPTRIFNVLRAARAFPLPDQLPRQIESLYTHIAADAKLLSPASLLVASTLAVDCYTAGLAGEFLPYFVQSNG